MKKFTRYKTEYVTLDEMNAHLKICKAQRVIVNGGPMLHEGIGLKAFIEDKMVEFRLTYKRGSKACTYIFFKDGRAGQQKVSGGEAFRILSMYFKVPRVKVNFSASPLLYKNEKYENKRTKAIGYDLNSAYSWAMLQDMPDTSKPPRAKQVEAGEIGFTLEGDRQTTGFSAFVFDLIESPFKKFINRWYELKQDTKTRAKAKGVLNYSVGYLQRVNPFLRAQIVGICNDYIKSLIDDKVIYCNTDAIVTTEPIESLVIGEGIGEWKVEREGYFAFKGFNYQWNIETPSYRGKPKSWFAKGWDILKDEIPTRGNMYEFKNNQIREVKK